LILFKLRSYSIYCTSWPSLNWAFFARALSIIDLIFVNCKLKNFFLIFFNFFHPRGFTQTVRNNILHMYKQTTPEGIKMKDLKGNRSSTYFNIRKLAELDYMTDEDQSDICYAADLYSEKEFEALNRTLSTLDSFVRDAILSVIPKDEYASFGFQAL